MRVRAIAIASEHANTVGTVELECTAAGLEVTYVDAARVGGDGATVAFTTNQRMVIDWSRVLQARPLGSANLLEFELPHAGPQRCLLVHFTTGNEVTLQVVQQRRLLLRLWIMGIAVVVASGIALAAPRMSPGIGPIAGLVSGVLFAGLLITIGLTTERWLADGGRRSRAIRDAFIGDLLSFMPELNRDPLAPAPKPFKLPRFDRILPRTTLAISLTLAGALLAALVMFRWIVSAPTSSEVEQMHAAPVTREPARLEAPPAEELRPAPTPLPTIAAPPPVDTAEPTHANQDSTAVARVTGPCDCPRSDSLLWSKPIPSLSLVVLASRRYKRKEHDRVELEFAAINNSNQDISELTSMAEFFQQDPPPSSKLISVSTRAVYFDGPLRPGAAIKWHVDAEGMTFRLHPAAENGRPITGTIDEHGDNAAPTNSIALLLKAHNRPVRLHGAMLLAYLRDPRARDAAVELGDSMRDSESSYLRRLMEALGEIRTCQVQVSTSGAHRRVFACVFNTADTPRTPVQVVVRALDATVSLADPVGNPPQMLAESSVALPGGLPAKAGVFAQIDLDFGKLDATPAAYEVAAQTAAAGN
jgi:hypothetical protein